MPTTTTRASRLPMPRWQPSTSNPQTFTASGTIPSLPGCLISDALIQAQALSGIEPDVRPVAFDRAGQEGLHTLVDLAAETRDLRLADPLHAECLDQVIDRAGRDALDIGFLDHRSERLLGHPTGFEEAGEVAAMAQLGNAQLDGACAGVPVAVAVTVALVAPVRCSFPDSGATERFRLQGHQPLSGEADHVAQEAGVRTLLQKLAKGDLVIGHRGSPWVRVARCNPTLPSAAAVTTAVDK